MREIPLTQGQVARVDDEDYDMLMAWKWCAQWNRFSRTYYAVRSARVSEMSSKSKSRPNIVMHKVITGWTETDHLDHDGLNNQRMNLREVTRAQNLYNRRSNVGTSHYKGVGLYHDKVRWRARIKINNKETHLGIFITEAEAARAYNRAALEYFGEFAYLNVIEDV